MAILYVKQNATGNNNGSSWNNAYTDLQNAIAASSFNDEIWVAKGTYTPGTSRSDSFSLKNFVGIYGGFAGNETSRSQRNWENNETILSGDIGTVGDNSDNSYNVVVTSNITPTAILDGFTISGGNSNSFLNSAAVGGGIYISNGSPTLANLVITDNSARRDGGGMYYQNSSPTLTNISFNNNFAGRNGGGIYSFRSNSILSDVTFENNVAAAGGAIFNWQSNLDLINGSFKFNVAQSGAGGAIYNYFSDDSSITNSLFQLNTSTDVGGAIYNRGNSNDTTIINNTTFTGNIGRNGGAVYTNAADTTINNSILWNNQAIISGNEIDGTAATVSSSIIQGGYTGTGNIDVDPNFVNDANFNLSLNAGSPGIDAGDNSLIPTDDTDLDKDGDITEQLPLDLDRNTRIVNGTVDMGAYEYSMPMAPGSAMGETGTISNLTHTARTINLSHTYQNPVIFAQPLSYNGAAPATVRLSNIESDSFTIQVQEPNNEDGNHAGENLSFMVLEAGTWELADGTKLQVGSTDSNQLVSQGWETVNFNAGFNNNPVVMSQIQTFNGADFVRTRQDNISANGFLVGMEEEEANQNSGHTNETIGYMAMSGGSGNWNGLKYAAGYTGDNVTDAWKTQSFGAGFTQTPQILASLASYDGADPAGIRRRNLNNNQVQFKVEEDTSADAEMAHTTENVSYLAIEGTGLLSATSLASAMGETGTISNLTHTARTINLSRNYVNPVVFAQPLSYNGSAPAAVRLDNITNNSFSVSVQEPNNEDGIHAGENLSFMVLEAGTWELADGTKLQVGTTDSSQQVAQGWETVNFNAGFNSNPVVMSQIQTFNGSDFVRTRQDNISANGFLVGMEEEEANKNTGHANETIGYMAMSGGSGNWSGLNYTAGYSGDRITDNWGTVNFGAGFTQTPQILASLATYDGSDPAGIRRRNLSNNQVQFKVEEDTSADAEMAHTTENVSFLAIEGSGILEAVNIDQITPSVEDPLVLTGVQTLNATSAADTFILGDATEAYYDNMGIQDYALILNFDSSEDVIQLHGSAGDYLLGAAPSEVPQGTGIFLDNNELVGVVSGVSDLALDADYFSFV